MAGQGVGTTAATAHWQSTVLYCPVESSFHFLSSPIFTILTLSAACIPAASTSTHVVQRALAS